MSYRPPSYSNNSFAFDVGTNSIGWCVFDLDETRQPIRVRDCGVRIFSDGRDPKSRTSLAVARREARAMARSRDRYLRRRKKTLSVLTEYGLMPADDAERKRLLAETVDHPAGSDIPKTDPYNLRLRALTGKLPLFQIGRALFHLGQRRGFKSNRKTDKKSNDKGKIDVGIGELKKQIQEAGAATLGAYLATRRSQGHVVRIRAGSEASGEADGYAFYPERSMLEDEFHKIWEAQSAFYPDVLTAGRRDHLFKVIFYQRPLKKPKIGRCSFNPNEERLAKAHPLFQEFRLYKEVNELGVRMPDMSIRKLTVEERDTLVSLLRPKRKIAFSTLRKALKLPAGVTFNKESESRKDIAGDEIYAAMSDKKLFGPQWADFSQEKQWDVIGHLREEEEPQALREWLYSNFRLDDAQVEAVADARLPEGYGRLGQSALAAMLEELKSDVIPEAKAAENCGYDHSLFNRDNEGLDKLPCYQEVLERHIPPGTGDPDDIYDIQKGRITNPTVHIGLNQLRKITNALLRKYGKPVEIAVELARDLQLSDKQKREVNSKIAENTRAARGRSEKLKELGQHDNGYNRQLLKLWEELNEKPENRICIYSGRPINIGMLFSGEVDIDHILPWSRTLDDSQANKLLCLKKYNREKGNHAPAEVTEWANKYDKIIERASCLPKNKQWRFAHDAMQRFEKEGGFLARQLTDTQYLSRMALEYLNALYPAEEPDKDGVFQRRKHVRVVPGRLTELLRRNWGLNSILADHNIANTNHLKNRSDHRHHAIDAAVVGVTSQSLLQKISSAAARPEGVDFENSIKRIVAASLPWQGFRDNLEQAINILVVSHKADHGTVSRAGYGKGEGQTAGQLHNETAYGLTGEKDEKGNTIVVRRKLFLSLKAKDIDSIRDEDLKAELYTAVAGLAEDKQFQEALLHFQKNHKRYKGIRRVRVTETLNVIPIRNAQGLIYKGYKGDANYRYDVWKTLDDKWIGEVISMFEIHQPGWKSKVHSENPTAKKVLSLHQNDMVAYDHPDDGYTIARVVKFDINKNIVFAPHFEADVDKRSRDKDDPFKYFTKTPNGLKKIHCRQVRIDPVGKVFDPGLILRNR